MPIEILQVDGGSRNLRLTGGQVRGVNRLIRVHMASDGAEAISFLRREGSIYLGAPRPDFILLDPNGRKLDGFEVLAYIQDNVAFKSIPVIILAGADGKADALQSYGRQANLFLGRLVDWSEFETLVMAIDDFWLAKAKLSQPILSDADDATSIAEPERKWKPDASAPPEPAKMDFIPLKRGADAAAGQRSPAGRDH